MTQFTTESTQSKPGSNLSDEMWAYYNNTTGLLFAAWHEFLLDPRVNEAAINGSEQYAAFVDAIEEMQEREREFRRQEASRG